MTVRILGPDQCKPYIGPRNPLRPDGINRIAYGYQSELCEDWATAQDPYAVARVLEQAQDIVPMGWLDEYAILCPAQRLVALDEGGAPMDSLNGERFDGWIVLSGVLDTGLPDPLEDVLLHELAHEVAKRFIGPAQQTEFFGLTKLPVGDNLKSQWQDRPQELIAEYLSAALWETPLDLRMAQQFGAPALELLVSIREWALNLIGDWHKAPIEVVTEKRAVTLTIGSTVAMVNGEEKTLEVAPILRAGRTGVPLRLVGEALGANVWYDSSTGQIGAELGNTLVTLRAGSDVAWAAGRMVTLDVAPWIENNRTLVPLRFLAEAFGFQVEWNGETRTVTVSK